MKIGIDLGTTNSALAYIDEREGGRSRLSSRCTFSRRPQLWRRDAWKRGARCRRFCIWATGSRSARTRASRARWCRPTGPLGEIVAVESGRRSHGEDSAVGRAGGGRVLSPVEVSTRDSSRKFRDAWDQAHAASPLAEQDVVLTVPGVVRRRGARADGDGGARGRASRS